MDINEIPLVDFLKATGWFVSLHKLYYLSPNDANQVEGIQTDVTVWDIIFVQDLFEAVNDDKLLLLDVGWYPDGDVNGQFRLELVSKSNLDEDYDWMNPVMKLETRSIDLLVSTIRKQMGNASL